MKNKPTIVIWESCDPSVSEAIRQFEERWRPYSMSSRRYPIMRLIQEVIDPAVAAYMTTLPARYSGFVSGVSAGMGFSEAIRLVGLEAMVRLQRRLLRHFIKTVDRQNSRDQRFVATIESVIGLVWDCACKQPEKSKFQGTNGDSRGLNGRRPQRFCRFCGKPTGLTSFANDSSQLRGDEDKLRLSDLYCVDHQPKLLSGAWNPAYRQAKRSLVQFDLELTRLNRQCAKRSTPQAASGDLLVDSYFYHYLLGRTIQPADKSELRHQARLMVDSKLSDRKKQMLMLQFSGFNQSEIARKLGIGRQAVSKALASIPEMFHLKKRKRQRKF